MDEKKLEEELKPITIEEAYAVYGVEPPSEIGVEATILTPEMAAKVYDEC